MNVRPESPAGLERFVAAQNPVLDVVRHELATGRKETHWIWFIFPQIAGLGHSPMSYQFAIESADEARRYLQHPVLGPRLRECTQLVLACQGASIDEILGHPDNLKFRSCMTLFALCAPDEPLFPAALEKYFAGGVDRRTVELLGKKGPQGASA